MSKGRVVVITGCSSGIGLESAKYLKKRFLNVYPTARKSEDVEKLKKIGFENAFLLDLRKKETIDNTIEYVLKKEGKIDVWFNNGGYGQLGAVEDLTIEAIKEQFETNFFGTFYATKEVVKIMKRQKEGGKIIQHSSILGLISLPFRGAYNSSKYALEGLNDTLRLELNNTNVKIITLNTGPIISKFRENAIKTLSNIDTLHSDYKEIYQKAKKGEFQKVPFTLTSEAVADIVHKIILSPNPKPRYYITKASYLLAFAKRVLPTTILDRLLLKI